MMIETTSETLKEINDIIQNFIWEGKTVKIAQNTLIKNIDEGGIVSFDVTLSGIKRFCRDTEANWKTLPKPFYDCDD